MMRVNLIPFPVAMSELHPDKVWPAILARREALLGTAQAPTRKAAVPMGIHATPGACRRGDADTDSLKGCRFESGETGDRTASGGQSTIERTTPENLHDSSSPATSSPKKPVQSVRKIEKRRAA